MTNLLEKLSGWQDTLEDCCSSVWPNGIHEPTNFICIQRTWPFSSQTKSRNSISKNSPEVCLRTQYGSNLDNSLALNFQIEKKASLQWIRELLQGTFSPCRQGNTGLNLFDNHMGCDYTNLETRPRQGNTSEVTHMWRVCIFAGAFFTSVVRDVSIFDVSSLTHAHTNF